MRPMFSGNGFAELVNRFYLAGQGAVFKATGKSPERAHELLVQFLRANYRVGIHKLYEKKYRPPTSPAQISNAAGFNKNGEIPPCLLRLLGFDRVVIGTVTGSKWEGNPKPRCLRFPKTHSMVNWMGLPGLGAKVVRRYLDSYRNDLNPPLTLNLAPTPRPNMSLGEKIEDVRNALSHMAGFEAIDRVELNISCPNIHEHGSSAFSEKLENETLPMITAILPLLEAEGRELYLKISPDLSPEELRNLLNAVTPLPVAGLTSCNTTTAHDPEWIPESPGTGGASGEAVYAPSRKTQEFLAREKPDKLRVIACGGINSQGKVRFLLKLGVTEFQVYTPVVFQGFSLIGQLKPE